MDASINRCAPFAEPPPLVDASLDALTLHGVPRCFMDEHERQYARAQAALAGRHPLVVADAQRLCARRAVAKINGECARERDGRRHPHVLTRAGEHEVVADAPLRLTPAFVERHSIDVVVHGDDIAPDAEEAMYGAVKARAAGKKGKRLSLIHISEPTRPY